MKKLTFLLSFAIMGSMMLYAQSAKDLRSARATALNVYDRYIIVMNSLRNGGDYALNFKNLFASNTDSIYNDIIPQPGNPYLNSDDYCQKYNKSVKQADYFYSDFSMEQPRQKGDKWVVVCHFKRMVRYRSKNNFYYPGWQFDYTMRVSMSRNAGDDGLCSNPQIVSLTVSNPIENFVVVMNPSRIPIQWDGVYNAKYDQKCDCWTGDLGDKKISDLADGSSSPFGGVTYSSKPPHFYTYQLSKRNIVGGGVYFAPIAFGNKLDDQFADINEKNNAFRFRAFYGINIMNTSSSAAFLNLGLEFSNRSHKLSGSYETHYNSLDSDSDSYVRNIYANIDDEQVKVISFGVPITFSYLLKIAGSNERPHYFSVDAGLYASFKALTSHKLTMNATYTGTYNYFGQIEFDHYYDYGHFDLTESNIKTDIKENLNKFDAGFTLGLGLWFSVGNGSFLRADVTMLKGLLSELKYNSEYRITESKDKLYHTALQSSDKGAFDIYFGLSFIKAL